MAEGKIKSYGTATWNGYRMEPGEGEYLSLTEVLGAAQAAGGENHHFRVVQLPLNLGMPEAFSKPNQSLNGETTCFLAAAAQRGVTRHDERLHPPGTRRRGASSHNRGGVSGVFHRRAARHNSFTRSARPGVAVALVGMRQMDHVVENMEVAQSPPASFDDFIRLFREE